MKIAKNLVGLLKVPRVQFHRKGLCGSSWAASLISLTLVAVLLLLAAIRGTGLVGLAVFSVLLIIVGYQVISLIPLALYPSEAFFLSALTSSGIITLLAVYTGYLGIPLSPIIILPPLAIISFVSSAVSYRQRSNDADFEDKEIRPKVNRKTDIIAAILVVGIGLAIPLKEVLRFPFLIGWDPWAAVATIRAIQLSPIAPSSLVGFVLGTSFFFFLAAVANVSGFDAFTLMRFAGPILLALLSLGLFTVVRRAFGFVPGLISALLLVGSPWVIVRFTLGIRENFGLVYLLGLLLFLTFSLEILALKTSKRSRPLILLALTGGLFYAVILSSSWVTHLVAAVFVLSLALLLWLFRKDHEIPTTLMGFVLIVAIAGVLLVFPLSIPVWESYLVSLLDVIAGAQRPGYRPLLTETLWGDFSLAILATVAFGLVIATRRLAMRDGRTLRKMMPMIALALSVTLIFLILLPFAESVALFRLLLYFILASIPFAALGWYLLVRGIKKKYVRAAVAVVLVGFALLSGFQVLRWSPFTERDFASADFVGGLNEVDNGVIVCPILPHCELLKYRDVPNILSVGGHLRLQNARTLDDFTSVVLSEFDPPEHIIVFVITKHQALLSQNFSLFLSELEPVYSLVGASIWIISWAASPTSFETNGGAGPTLESGRDHPPTFPQEASLGA